jgi:hypothetical protein
MSCGCNMAVWMFLTSGLDIVCAGNIVGSGKCWRTRNTGNSSRSLFMGLFRYLSRGTKKLPEGRERVSGRDSSGAHAGCVSSFSDVPIQSVLSSIVKKLDNYLHVTGISLKWYCQKILAFQWTQEFHYRVHRSCQFDPTLNVLFS